MGCDAQTLVNLAAANGYDALSDRDLRMAIVAAACAGGGGGGATACLVAQSGAPVAACAFDFGLAYDNDSASPTAGNFWFWDKNSATWIKFIG